MSTPSTAHLAALFAQFDVSDLNLIAEGLAKLLETKKEALATLQDSPLQPSARGWEPIDFGIPDIEELIAGCHAAM